MFTSLQLVNKIFETITRVTGDRNANNHEQDVQYRPLDIRDSQEHRIRSYVVVDYGVLHETAVCNSDQEAIVEGLPDWGVTSGKECEFGNWKEYYVQVYIHVEPYRNLLLLVTQEVRLKCSDQN